MSPTSIDLLHVLPHANVQLQLWTGRLALHTRNHDIGI
jgi:hypothetical protein